MRDGWPKSCAVDQKVLKFEWPENRETAPLRICTQLPQWCESGDKTIRHPILFEQFPSRSGGHQTRSRCQLSVASETEHYISMLRHSHIVEWIPAVECPPIENACCIKHCDPKWAAHLLHFGGGHLSNLCAGNFQRCETGVVKVSCESIAER